MKPESRNRNRVLGTEEEEVEEVVAVVVVDEPLFLSSR
jgi:hypothetical protein